MIPRKEQIKLLRRRYEARWNNTKLFPTRENFNYLKKFFLQQQKTLTLTSVFSLFIQGLAEIGLIFISHQYLKNSAQFYNSINSRNLFLFIFLGILLYLLASFTAIKSERTLVIRLINELRQRWFKLSLSRPKGEPNIEEKGSLLAKISYHLPLLSTGLTNSLVGLIHWLLLILIFIFLSFIFGLNFFYLALAAIIGSLLIALGAFYVSRNYVTRETTFYSRIIKLVDLSLSDWHFTKSFEREQAVLSDFNELVELDSYFRVRRDLWLRFSPSLIFVILIFLSWLASSFGSSLTNFFSSSGGGFILIIFFIYLSRLLYESLRIGLYSVPFALGLALSIPTKKIDERSHHLKLKFQEIIFQLVKAKIFKNSPCYKDLHFCFRAGGRYLVSAPARQGKTILARLFVGLGQYARRAWIIKVDKKRYFYNDFFGAFSGFYYFDPNFTSNRTILEVALGKEKTRIKDEDFLRLSERVNSCDELRGIFFERQDWRLKTSKFTTNAKNILLIQVLYCLEKKPSLITIDNYWLDRRDPEIDQLLRLLAQALPDSILIFFSSVKRDLLAYDEYYEI